MEKNKQTGAPSPDETRKMLKKYARREARAMQAFEQARQDLKRAEQKLSKATRNLQEQQIYLQVCENKLVDLRSARRAFQASTEGSPENGHQEVPQEAVTQLADQAPGAAETTAGETGIVAAVEEVLKEMTDVEEAIDRAVNETAEDLQPLAEQTVFDANETITMDEFALEEMLAGDDFSPNDDNSTRDLAAPGEEQTPISDSLSAGTGENDPEQERDTGQISAESSQQSTRKAPSRRPRANTSSTARLPTTRKRGPSSRTRSNNTEKPSDESHE
jgi:hypothetical protein